jgi:hypothetical protein
MTYKNILDNNYQFLFEIFFIKSYYKSVVLVVYFQQHIIIGDSYDRRNFRIPKKM